MTLKPLVLIAILLAAALAARGVRAGQLSEYYIDYADTKQGASITSPSQVHPAEPRLENIITPAYHGSFIFADGVEQREEFTIDLGQERKLGMFIFEMTHSTVYEGEVKRKPNSLTVDISTQSANGPWTRVYHLDPADVVMSFALEDVPARWVRFDLGVNTDGIGSRVRKVKIYKRYRLKTGPEIMKEFHKQFRRDAEGLGDFWKAVDEGRWEDACDAVIEHYSHWPPEGRGAASPRVKAWMENTNEEGGCVYKYDGPDWDWFRMKAECSHPSLGGPPGGATILHLLKSAYTATGDGAYAKQLAALLRDWMQDSPCPGVHRGQDGVIVSGWAGIVASQRTWSFGTMVHAMFPEKQYFDRDLKINLLYSLWQHINYMRDIFPELGGNWLTNANSCMFTGAVEYPEFVQYKEWLEHSKSFFETSLTRDFYPSGRAHEDSTMYVPIASNQVTGQYATMKKAGLTVSAEAQQRMENLWDCFASMHYADLSVPAIGDAHRDSPLTRNGHVVPPGYVEMFDRPDFLYLNTQGKQGTRPAWTSRGFTDSGWYIMRGKWDTRPYADARQLFFKAATGRGHGHRDQLQVTMYAYGREILTDPGNPTYGIPIEGKVTPTAVHNTICVDGKDQELRPGKENKWNTSEHVDFVDGECEGYPGLLHRRQIVFLKDDSRAPDYWLIRDSVSGEGQHKFDLNYHFSEKADPRIVGGSVVSTYPQGGNALLRLVGQDVKPEIVDANIALVLELVPSRLCRYTKEQAGPVTFDTLIVPFKGPKPPAVKTEYIEPDAETTDAVCVRVTTEKSYDLIAISSKPGSIVSFHGGRIKTDGDLLVIRQDKKGKWQSTHRLGGSFAEYNGKKL